MKRALLRLSGLLLLAGLAGAGGATQLGSAATQVRAYSLTRVAGPASVAGGSTSAFTFRLANLATSTQDLGSANVTPVGFSVTSPAPGAAAVALTTSAGKSWTLRNVGNVLQLRAVASSDALKKGAYVDLTVSAKACFPGQPWTSQAMQSIDLTGTDVFTISGSNPTIAASGSPVHHVAFTAQPGPTEVGTAMDPGPEVTLYDHCAAVAERATGQVSLTVTPDTGVTLGGNTATPTNGVASFDALTVSRSGTYEALASYTGAAGATSDPFMIFDDYVLCHGAKCSGKVGGEGDPTSIQVDVPAGSDEDGFLGVSLGHTLNETISCTRLDGTTRSGSSMGLLQTVVPPSGFEDPLIQVVVRYSKIEAPATGVSNFVICKTDENGDFHELGTCSKKGTPTEPCISDRRRNWVGDLVLTMFITSADPVGGGFR